MTQQQEMTNMTRARLTERNLNGITKAMRNLLEAHHALQGVRDDLVNNVLPTINPSTDVGKMQERFIVDINRAMASLTLAVTRVPDEFWFAHFNDNHAGMMEVLRKVRAA